jgi:predicted amidohydrolase
VHLPGHADGRSHYPFQHLEKRYFEPGDLGFPVWRAFGANVGMCICNDRRWPETYRVMGMQSVELLLLGYNTPTHLPWIPVYDHLAGFHNHLCMQAGAYQNSTWVALQQGGDVQFCTAPPGRALPVDHGAHRRHPAGLRGTRRGLDFCTLRLRPMCLGTADSRNPFWSLP